MRSLEECINERLKFLKDSSLRDMEELKQKIMSGDLMDYYLLKEVKETVEEVLTKKAAIIYLERLFTDNKKCND